MVRLPIAVLSLTAIALMLQTFPASAKGKTGVDRMLKQAIEDTAMQAITPPPPEPEPAPIIEPVIEPEPAPVVVQAPEPAPVVAPSKGIRVGQFLMLPSLDLAQGYNSNVRAVDNNGDSDFFAQILPALNIELQDSAHAFNFSSAYEVLLHYDETDEDEDNLMLGIDGHIQASDNVQIPYEVSYVDDHEDRADDYLVQLPNERIERQTLAAKTGLRVQGDQFGGALLGFYTQKEFDDGRTAAGTQIVRRDADHEDYGGEAYLSYKIGDDYGVKIGGSYSERDYDTLAFQGGGFTGPSRDSEHYEGYVGWDLHGPKTVGELRIGYEERSYDDTAIDSIDDFTVLADIDVMMSDKTTVNFHGDRRYFEDDEIITPILRTQAGVGVEHFLTEKVKMGLGGGYTIHDFEQQAREDEIVTGNAMLAYMLNNNLTISAEYTYDDRDSDVSGFDYDRHIAFLRLKGEL